MRRMKKHYFVLACSFFFCLGGNILGFSMIFRLTDRLSFTPGQIGSYIALGQLFYFLGCNLYHRFGSAFNPARIFPFAAVLVFLASVLLGFARSRSLVYAANWVLQFSTGLFWPPVMAYLTEGLTGKELNRKIGLFNRSWMTANLIGPLIAGTLYHWNSGANFFFLSLSYSLVLLLLFLMRRYSLQANSAVSVTGAAPASAAAEEHSLGTSQGSGQVSQAHNEKLDLYRYRGWINAFCSSMFLGVLANILPLHIRDGLGYTERSAGMLLFFRSMTGLIGFSVLANLSFWQFNRKWFFIMQGGLILCAFFFLFVGSRLFFYFAIAILYGFLNSGCYDNSIFYSGSTGKNPKKNLALHEIVMSIGNAAGTAGGGFIYQHFRFIGTCLALLLALSMGMVLLVFLDRKERVAG